MTKKILNVAVIGAGYWGKNLVRNFSKAKRCRLKYVCDLDEEVLARHDSDPYIETTTDLNTVLSDNEVKAVVIATEAPRHYEIAKQALSAGKHIYVEKPMTLKSVNAKKLVELANTKNLKLMVGHLLKYHPAVSH